MNIVSICKTLGDMNRFRIINLLLQEELCVCEIEAVLDLNQSNVSRHLMRLKNEKLIKMRKKAQWSYYCIGNYFLRNQDTLCKLIRQEADTMAICKNDSKRLAIYRSKHFNCDCVSKNREDVMNLLKEEIIAQNESKKERILPISWVE